MLGSTAPHHPKLEVTPFASPAVDGRYLLMADLSATRDPVAWGRDIQLPNVGRHQGILYLMSSDLTHAFADLTSYEVSMGVSLSHQP
jgi:hypothetical protein